jgi:hypothetical protein
LKSTKTSIAIIGQHHKSGTSGNWQTFPPAEAENIVQMERRKLLKN